MRDCRFWKPPDCASRNRNSCDLTGLASEVYEYIQSLKRAGRHIGFRKIAVMGCVVNGPGEAHDADIGLAGGDGKAVVFKSGKIVATLPETEALELLKREILEHSR